MTLTVEMAVQLIGTLIAIAGFAWGLLQWQLVQLRERDKAIEKEREERTLADAAETARAKSAEEMLSKSLADHKLYAAENFATSSELSAALEGIKKSIDRLTDRLDKLLMETRP